MRKCPVDSVGKPILLQSLTLTSHLYSRSLKTQYVRRAQTPTLECITLLQVKEYEDGSSDSEWHCQILERSTASNGIRGNIVPIADIGKIPKTLINQFESARTLLIVPGGTIGASGGLEVPNSNLIRVEKIPDDGSRARRLEGDNVNIRVIVIRVTAGTDPVYSTTANATKISDRVFGTDGDEVNLVSQYEQCSFGKLTVSPVTALNDGDPTLSAPGVYEVQVSSTDNTNNSILRTAIIHQLNADWPSSPLPESFKTQVSGTSPFDHIMICMPPETQGVGIACELCVTHVRFTFRLIARPSPVSWNNYRRVRKQLVIGIQEQLVSIPYCSDA